jgi:hypothetical protein
MMNEHDFCLWLQGFAELNTHPPTPEQWQSIREHLQTVFKKVTPDVKGSPFPIPLFPDESIVIAPNWEVPMFPHDPMEKAQPTNIGAPSYGPGIIC